MTQATQRSTVVGVFRDRRRAEEAVQELHRAGFGDDQVGFAAREGEAPQGSEAIAEGHEGGDAGGAAIGAAGGGLVGALTGSMGVPEDEARYYDQEFQSGRTIVTVKADGRYDEAQRILRDHDAYDVTRQPGATTATGTT